MATENEQARVKRIDRHHRHYQKMVDEKRCTCCGKQDERTLSGRVYCMDCYKRHKANASPRKKRTKAQQDEENKTRREWQEMCRKLHMCVNCGAKDRYTINNHRLCLKCSTKKNSQQRAKYDKQKASEYTKKRRDAWREQGRCTYCGGKKEEPDKVMCIDCRVKARMQRIKRMLVKGD